MLSVTQTLNDLSLIKLLFGGPAGVFTGWKPVDFLGLTRGPADRERLELHHAAVSRACREILDGTWKSPEAQPVS